MKNSRSVIISGKDKFIPLTDLEKSAHLIYIWVAFTRAPAHPFFNYNWFRPQGLFCRMEFWRDNFVIESKLVRYANELVYKESAPSLRKQIIDSCNEINNAKRSADELSYGFQKQIEVLSGEPLASPSIPIVSGQLLYASGIAALLLGGDANKFSSGVNFPYYWYKGRNAHGCLIEGIGYSCESGVEGQLTIHSYTEEWCTIPGTFIRIGRDETGRPPASSSTDPPPGGSGGPGSETPPTGTAPPPPAGQPVPPGPDDPNGYQPPSQPADGASPGESLACAQYEIEISGARFNGTVSTSRRIVPGKIGGITKVYGYDGLPPQYWGYFYKVGIGCPGQEQTISTTFSGIDLPGGQPDGVPTIKILRKL